MSPIILKYKVIKVCRKPSSEVELHISRSPIIRIGLAPKVNLLRILQNYLALKLPDIGSSTVQCYGF
jgi:hypothetical protein